MHKENDIREGLERDARQIAERLPEKLTASEIEKLVKSVKRFKAENGFTNVQISRWIGYSKSVMPSFLSGKYGGNIEKLAGKLVFLMNSVDRKNRRVKHDEGFVETEVAKRIGTLIVQTEAFSDIEGRIGIVIGDGGHGKSHCLRQYAKADKNSIYIQYDDSMTATTLFGDIAKKLKRSDDGSLAAITSRLVRTMRDRHIVVMIDEASSLSVKDLNRLRQVLVVKARCPLILAGNADLLKTIYDRSNKKGYESLDQFNSRLMSILNLDELASRPGDGMYSLEEVRRLYEYGGIKLTSNAVDTLRRICRVPKSGRLRTCGHIICALHMSSVIAEKGVIDKVAILSAIAELGLPVSDWLPVVIREALDDPRRAVATAG